jgi:hypothetical protein
VWNLFDQMIAPVLAAFVFTSTFFALMWLYDLLTATFYYYLQSKEVKAYEKMIIKTEELIKREKAFQAEINKLISQYKIVSMEIKPSDEQTRDSN